MVVLRSLVSFSAAIFTLTFLSAPLLAAAQDAPLCSASNQCPSYSPCCSQWGYCGPSTSFAHCGGGCDPNGSFSHKSCTAMPRCKNQVIDFRNSAKPYVPIASYKGNALVANMTLDAGVVRPAVDGLYVTVGKDTSGAVLSTTRYVYYGRVSAKMRHKNNKGVVAAFIMMSNTRDELDWEFTTDQANMVQTNMFPHWGLDEKADYSFGVSPKMPSTFTTEDWHTYTLDWSPTKLDFEVDGQVVRTIYASDLRTSSGASRFPSTPSRVQISSWTSQSMGSGMQWWTGGAPDWTRADSYGTFWAQFQTITIECYDVGTLKKGPNYLYGKSINPKTGQRKIISTHNKSTV